MTIDWCHINFVNLTGELTIKGDKIIDASQNKCKHASVDIGTGKLKSCINEPCNKP
jgi:hypothetical protein